MTFSEEIPACRARTSKSRILRASWSRNPVGSGCWTVVRSCGTRLSRGFAAATSGFMPLATGGASTEEGPISVRGVGRGGGGAAAARPPGVGLMIVRSGSGAANGSSCVATASASDRPELEREPGKITRHVHRERRRLLELRPQVAAPLELEVSEAGVVRNLARRYRHRVQPNAGKLQVHEVADLLDWADLDLKREAHTQHLRRDV